MDVVDNDFILKGIDRASSVNSREFVMGGSAKLGSNFDVHEILAGRDDDLCR